MRGSVTLLKSVNDAKSWLRHDGHKAALWLFLEMNQRGLAGCHTAVSDLRRRSIASSFTQTLRDNGVGALPTTDVLAATINSSMYWTSAAGQ